MCFAALMPAIQSVGSFLSTNATALQFASAGLSAIGTYQQSAAQKSAMKYSAAVANANAKVAEFKAQDAIDRGVRDAEEVGRRQAAIRGKQRAGFAAAGLDLSSGSAAGVLEATDYYGLGDQATAIDNASKEAFAHRAGGANYQAEAAARTAQASNISPVRDAGFSLLGSATKIATRWYDTEPAFGSGAAWSFPK